MFAPKFGAGPYNPGVPTFDTSDILAGAWAASGGWLVAMALLGIGIALLLWRWWAGVRGPMHGSAWRRVVCDDGTATIEFALVFPVLLVMILALIQTTFAFTGVMFVNYAAFIAARSAIVEVPRDLGDENRNVVAGSGSQKRENIRGAAAFALMPVSGPGTASGLSSDRSVGTAVDNLYAREGLDTPKWSERLADRRLGYALDHTDVVLLALGEPTNEPDAFRSGLFGTAGIDFGYAVSPNAVPEASYRYGPRDPIRVVVRHRFHLSIPFVGRLFSNGTHSVDGTTTPYRVIQADFTLTNEGIWRDPPLESPEEAQGIPRRLP